RRLSLRERVMIHAMQIARTGAFALVSAAILSSAPALAQSTSQMPYYARTVASAASDDDAAAVSANLRRQVVSYNGPEAAGTIIVDTPTTYLYSALGGGKATRSGIGVAREGSTWSGVKTVERKAEWPDGAPPAEMLGRQPYLPRFMAGGPSNPLGARAMY